MARPRRDEQKNRPNHLGVRVTDDVREALRTIAERRNLPVSDVVHEALEKFIAREERKPT